MNISQFYEQARALLNDVDSGNVDATTLSDEGRLALDIAARKVSVNDLSNEGRVALGLDPLPQPQGMVTSPIPFGSKVGQAALDTTTSVLKGLGLDTLGQRTGEFVQGAIEAVKEVPGQVKRAGESFRQAAELAMGGQFGHAAAELGGGVAETANAMMGIGMPLTIPLAPIAAAGGMAAEAGAKAVGLPEKFHVGAAELSPRMIGELAAMGLVPGGAELAATRGRAVRMPKITDPDIVHIKKALLDERIAVSQAAKNPNIGEGTRANLNARAALIRKAEMQLKKYNYGTKRELIDLLPEDDVLRVAYDNTSASAQEAAHRTQYVEPYPAGKQVSPTGAATPGVRDIGEIERASVEQTRDLRASVGLDPNVYEKPVAPPMRDVVETPVMEPVGQPLEGPLAQRYNVAHRRHDLSTGMPDNVTWPSMREIAPESLEAAVADVVGGPRPAPEGEAAFPGMFGALQDPGKTPGGKKQKLGKGPKAKRSQVVQIIKESNPELSTSAAAKVADATIKAAEATAKAQELPAAPRRAKKAAEPESTAAPGFVREEMIRRGLDPNRPLNDVDIQNPSVIAAVQSDPSLTPEQKASILRTGSPNEIQRIAEEAKITIDNVVMEDATRKLEVAPPVADAIKPMPDPTPASVSAAPPVESAAPVPAQPAKLTTKPTGLETAMRESTKKKLMAAGFDSAQVEKIWAAAQSMGKDGQTALAEILRKVRKQNKTAADFAASVQDSGVPTMEQRFINDPLSETWAEGAKADATKAVLNELNEEVSIEKSSREGLGPNEWRPPEGVAEANAPATKKARPKLDERTMLTYQAANDILRDRGQKLVISTIADPGKLAETVFLLQKRSGEPILDEITKQPRMFKSPEAAVEAITLEGPGAMAYVPDQIAKAGLASDTKSANLMVQKLFTAAGVPQPDLGAFTSHLRINTPGFVTRYDPNAHAIFSHAVDMDVRAVKYVNALRKRARQIAKQLADAKEENDIFLMGKLRDLDPAKQKEVLASISDNVKRLWEEHRKLEDSVFEQVKRSDPTVKYRKDHISQFPLDEAIERYFDDLAKAEDLQKHFPNEDRYKEQAKAYRELLQKLAEQKNQVELMRFERQPDGSFFGPLNEARMLNLDYQRSYIGVMERYLDGVERKLFLDRTLPVFKKLIKADSLANKPEMRLYLHDWMNGLRGMYGRRWRMSLENNLEALGVENPFARRRLAADLDSMVNVVNGLQAITYMGLKIKSIANNLTQTLMTTYPEIGARSFAKGVGAVFTKDGWRHARQLGLIDFIPDNLGELYREANDALRTKSVMKTINVATTFGTRITLKPFQFVEKINNVIAGVGGYDYARNVLKLDPFKAAEYARSLSLRSNYIMRPVNTPLRFTGPLGKMGGFLQRFKVNYLEQLWTNYERLRAGDPGPFVRQLGVYLALTGTEGLVAYNLVADQAMKKFGVELPKFNPLQWATKQAGIGSGIDMASSLAVLTPGAGGDVTSIVKPVIAQTVQNAFTNPSALVPTAARDSIRAFVEANRGYAESTRTGKPVAQRSNWDVILSSVGLQPWAEGLRGQYLRQIGTALEGGRVDVAMRLANEARQKGLRITGAELQAIRNSTRTRARGSSTAGQLLNQIRGQR